LLYVVTKIKKVSFQFVAEGRMWAGLPQPSWQSIIMAWSSYWKSSCGNTTCGIFLIILITSTAEHNYCQMDKWQSWAKLTRPLQNNSSKAIIVRKSSASLKGTICQSQTHHSHNVTHLALNCTDMAKQLEFCGI